MRRLATRRLAQTPPSPSQLVGVLHVTVGNDGVAEGGSAGGGGEGGGGEGGGEGGGGEGGGEGGGKGWWLTSGRHVVAVER